MSDNTYNPIEESTVYLVTVRKHRVKEYVTHEELKEIYREALIISHGESICLATELHGKYRQLHLHAIALVPPSNGWIDFGVYRPTSIRGYRVYWTKVKHYPKAYKYVNKYSYDFQSQEQQLYENYLNHYLGFIDAKA